MSPKIPYTKPPLTYVEQLDLLKTRGLIIDDDAKAIHLLETLNYYRLSGYWYPFLQDKTNHIFKDGATFDKAFSIYCFDRELRLLILREIEKIEIALRAKMIHILSHNYGTFWFRDPSIFRNPHNHRKSLVKINNEYSRSDVVFIDNFKRKYSDVYPPSWIILEIFSMGTLSMLYSNLKPVRAKKEIAKYFGIDKDSLSSWIHSLVYIRNVCAHHSRLWNREFRIQPNKPRRPKKQWLINSGVSNKRIYFVLSIVLYFLQSVNPNSTFLDRFGELMAKYPNIDFRAMGFPNNWKDEPLWGKK